MSIQITATNPVFIPSDTIQVFPCAGRGEETAAKYTSEFNLTHLGIPDISWTVGVKNEGSNKASGASMAAGDEISVIINGYFFEFTVPSGTWTGNVYASIMLSKFNGGEDPVQKQWKLTPISIGNNVEALSTDFDQSSKFRGMVLTTSNPLTLGTGNISNTKLVVKSLQLAESGKYLNVGTLPTSLVGNVANNTVGTAQLKDYTVTAAKLGNIIAQGSSTIENGIRVNLLQDESKGGLKIGLECEKVLRADTAEQAGLSDIATQAQYLGTRGIDSDQHTLSPDVNATTKTPLGVKLGGGRTAESSMPITVQLTGGVATSNIYNGAITTAKIADENITTAKIAPGAVNASRLSGNICQSNTQYLTDSNGLGVSLAGGAGGAITASLVNGVNTNDIKDSAVTSLKLASNSVTQIKIQNSAVTEAKIASKAVTASKLGSDVVDSTVSKLGTTSTSSTLGVKLTGGNGTPIKAELSGSVGTTDIKENAVVGSKLGAVVTTGSASSNGMTVSLSQASSKGGLKIGLSGSKVTNAGTADVAKQIMIGSTAYTLSFSGNVLTFSS